MPFSALWLDHQGHEIRVRGPEDIARCPSQIAIVSTGLIFHESEERKHLLQRKGKYGTVILDEAHRGRRRGGMADRGKEPNNLLDFMLKIGARTRHLLLGTATPIQTEVRELWDLLRVLNTDAEFVLGREIFGHWGNVERALPLVKGEANPRDEHDAWEWIRNPLPPASEHPVFANLRSQLEIAEDQFFSARGFGSLGFVEQQALAETLTPGFFHAQNPIVRHTVLRRRRTLEDAGLLERVGVNVYEEWGASGTIRIDPGTSGRGLSLVLAPSWGNASSGMDQIWSPRDAHGLSSEQEFEAESRVEGEIGYGLTVRTIPGVVTPYAGMTLGETGHNAWRSGMRWKASDSATLGVEAGSADEAGSTVGLRARLRF